MSRVRQPSLTGLGLAQDTIVCILGSLPSGHVILLRNDASLEISQVSFEAIERLSEGADPNQLEPAIAAELTRALQLGMLVKR